MDHLAPRHHHSDVFKPGREHHICALSLSSRLCSVGAKERECKRGCPEGGANWHQSLCKKDWNGEGVSGSFLSRSGGVLESVKAVDWSTDAHGTGLTSRFGSDVDLVSRVWGYE
jgi:hypothetical protein